MIPLGSLPNRFTIRARSVTGTDIYGNDVRTDGEPLEGVPGRADIAFQGEELTDRTEQRERYDIILPAGYVVEGWDGLLWEDQDIELEVDGPAAVVYDRAAPHHLELLAYRIRG